MTAHLQRLEKLAALRLDLKLGALRQEAEAVEALRAEIRHLANSALIARQSDPRVGEAYTHWTHERSEALSLDLARRLVRLEEARSEATRAFGQHDALSRLSMKR